MAKQVSHDQIRNQVNDVLALNWRTMISEDLSYKVESILEQHDLNATTEITIDHLRLAGIPEKDIADYYHIISIYMMYAMI